VVASLRTQLWFWLSGLLTVAGLLAAAFSFWTAQDEARSFFDNQLRLMAIHVGDPATPAVAAPTQVPGDHDPEDDFLVQVWDAGGTQVRSSLPLVDVPAGDKTGFSDVSSASGRWRTYTLKAPSRTVQVSQQSVVREELASDAALRSLIPVAVSIPLSWLLLSLVINRVLRRVDVVANRLAARKPGDWQPIPLADVPTDFAPLVTAANDLLSRLQGALSAQKRFVSDAAHELRTPLAALQIQIGNLRKAPGTELPARIDELERGVRRASQLTRQLLNLARSGETPDRPLVTVDLVELARSVMAEVLPLADHRRQDLGLVQSDPAEIEGDADDLRVLMGNLLENAIRYTPDEGVVDLAILAAAGSIAIEVRDSGPGIEPGLLEDVFQPFRRAAEPGVEGSGLGLTIARRIAEQHGAVITLSNRQDRAGLVARVTFNRPVSVTAR
jgi:two-component system, OmpR family, sensor kinase